MPVARWSFWSSVSESLPEVAFVDPMMRRRLSALSRMALKVAGDCVDAQSRTRVVFASRHGELRRTTDILRDIEANKPVSPNAFSLSVLNAMTGLFGIVRGDRSPATALSAGAQTLGYALLEGHALHAEDPGSPVLIVYADEPADARYGALDQEVQRGAFAMLLDASEAPQGRLACSLAENKPGTAAQLYTHAREFATQSEALHHCLSEGERTEWQGSGGTWQWSWHVGAA